MQKYETPTWEFCGAGDLLCESNGVIEARTWRASFSKPKTARSAPKILKARSGDLK
jgi:hypothetical protein